MHLFSLNPLFLTAVGCLFVFFRPLVFDEVYGCSFKLCILEFMWVILIGKHFYRDAKLWREGPDLTFHIAGVFEMRSGHVEFFISSKSDVDRAVKSRRGCVSALDLEVGNALGGMKSGRKRRLWWDAGYDTGCASWPRSGVWGRAGWVESLDMTRSVGWGIGRKDQCTQ